MLPRGPSIFIAHGQSTFNPHPPQFHPLAARLRVAAQTGNNNQKYVSRMNFSLLYATRRVFFVLFRVGPCYKDNAKQSKMKLAPKGQPHSHSRSLHFLPFGFERVFFFPSSCKGYEFYLKRLPAGSFWLSKNVFNLVALSNEHIGGEKARGKLPRIFLFDCHILVGPCGALSGVGGWSLGGRKCIKCVCTLPVRVWLLAMHKD